MILTELQIKLNNTTRERIEVEWSDNDGYFKYYVYPVDEDFNIDYSKPTCFHDFRDLVQYVERSVRNFNKIQDSKKRR